MSEYKYKSPIEIIQGEMGMHMDGEILKAVQNVGINIDKDELLKALAYDRDQYNKGYNDGKPKVGRWIPYKAYFGKSKDSWTDELKCSECGYEWGDEDYNYCPNCGAKMEGECYELTIPSETEAIQIPKEHGRLIDADKLRDEFSRTESGYCGGWEFCDKPEDFQFLIDDEPTILEAEE